MQEPPLGKGEQTRQEILAAARRLFLSQGYTATPMRQIAREVGITPAAIYNHYPGKDQLFLAVLEAAAPYDEMFALVDQLEAASAEEFIRRLFRAAITLITAHQEYLLLALIDAQERDGAALAALVARVLAPAQGWHRRLLALDAAQGARLRDLPFPLFLRALVSLLAGFALTQRVATPDRLPQFEGIDWPEALADLFLHGVLEPPVP